ncbi:S-adenosyl-L-methionine-dependent methyltransferase [Phialemonium atrogriseum]|uniref:S-adenosyl-L-methionine-dependent methyltransferase n=1 Tax=Phialemonium atrogriseum TaxID=1093897 RepID=A0AAJ0BUP5_9PEZI|nr:S-adenosyl-L-methionine-dependent methyltransferase [Phialemonium atrogriseum]KAK1763387.1 S-adenosyl-L-methionine-dependent methyltransferase [Phialemonium atrogriseum]
MADNQAPGKTPEATTGSASASPTPAATAPQPSSTLHSAQHWAQVEQDLPLHNSDNDSAVGDDNASSTASISSSILNYRTINGRTYHSERGNAQYWTPNDDKHNESMDIYHHFFTLALENKLFLAPLKDDIKKVLDVGTGTGIWAIDFADKFPGAEVTGTDISPIQPSWVPPNLKFEIDDCTQPWSFEDNSFDYVHLRFLLGSVDSWDELFEQAYRVCKPGGWVESLESSPRIESDDGTVTEETAINEWGKFFIEGGKKLGRPFTVVDDDLQKKAVEKAGFTNVNTWDFKECITCLPAPLGGWPKDQRMKEIGRFVQVALEQDPEGYVLYVASALGWTKSEVSVYCVQLRKEIRSGKYHPFYRLRAVWAQKPE